MWVLGLDAGGTKTHSIITNEKGEIIAEGFGGSANYQTCGVDKTKESLEHSINETLNHAGLKLKDIHRGLFGMAGADEEVDFSVLNPLVQSIMGNIPVEIVNDTWIGLRSGVEDNFGVVSVCGTGAAHAGRNRRGKSLILRNLDYELGNLGGGGDLVQNALHYAFRSEEKTFIKTCLEEDIKSILHVDTMDKVCDIIRREEMTSEHQYKIPIAVIRAAKEQDTVAKMLVEDMGYSLGQFACGLIKRLDLYTEKVPMVLIGSLFNTREPLLIDSYMRAVHEAAPLAYPVFPAKSPAMGAIGLLLDGISPII
jgi:N-acetylglucosamine kinase-like BadF-type ATPase